jgi:hypothetical protein
MRRPDQSSNAGNLEEVAGRGRLFFGYFLFGEAKESNLLSGTPDGVAFDSRDAR